MRHWKRKHLVISLLLIPILASCTGTGSPTETLALATLFVPPTQTSVQPTIPPTATAVEFQLRATSTPLPTQTPFPTDQLPGFGYGPSDFPPEINPLTGLPVTDLSLLNRRPMAIKITNFPRSVRPQWGLTAADHVYEYFLEDGMTRFVGIFYGQDAYRVGPVRSARPFDEHLLRMYKAILAFGYADDKVIDPWVDSNSDISKFLVIQRPDNCPPLCRIGPENDYNNLFADTQQLSQYITDRGINNERQDLGGLRFEANTLYGGSQGNRLTIRYSNTSHHLWEYDPASQRYLRSQEAESRGSGEEVYLPLFDSLTGLQVGADNLVILLAPIDYYYQSKSTEIYDIYLMGRGIAYVLREGRMRKIFWERYTQEALVSLVFPNGEPYPLKPGNVWFEVLGETSIVDTAEQTWQFSFDIP